ncbi:TPA: DUF2635 domain-containing protein [Serratia marcescens]|nr:DUF2635 domain-containing protein [Serratia marcescens]
MKIKVIKPKSATVQVRKPDGALLDVEGEALPLSAFWLRRIAEGDLEVSDIHVQKTELGDVAPAIKPTKAEK